jgi:oxygen-independent coproporphyrinogen-3 oxidase
MSNDPGKNPATVPDLAIYVHLPWCVRKCPYCDFNSHAANGPVPEQRYVDALLRDLQQQAPAVAGRPIVSIFIGGGTPSLFTPAAIARLLEGLRRHLDCVIDVEVTMEANPGAIERGRFAEYHAAGINRVSLGGQSFNPSHLQALGRIHSSADTITAAGELHAAGLDNFNIDLMYGLPGQSVPQALEDLRAAMALSPAHLSHYQLTLEPGTVFFHRPPSLPDDDTCWDMQLRSQDLLAEHGLQQYEISAYAPPPRRCRHNLNYWQFGDYVGLGAGAHGKISSADPAAPNLTVTRTTHPRHPGRYMDAQESGQGLPQARTVADRDLPFEFMLNALRLVQGFTDDQFRARTGLDLTMVADAVELAVSRGLLEPAAGPGWRPSRLGLRFLNELQMLFLPAPRLEKPASLRSGT